MLGSGNLQHENFMGIVMRGEAGKSAGRQIGIGVDGMADVVLQRSRIAPAHRHPQPLQRGQHHRRSGAIFGLDSFKICDGGEDLGAMLDIPGEGLGGEIAAILERAESAG